MGCLQPYHGQIIEDHEEYVEAVRIRLGAGGPIDGGICSNCGERSLDRAGGHATCCAIGESTRGHNALRDTVFTFAKIADPSAELEPENLIPSRPRDRPADVLTAAAPGCVAALDIGVASPAAASVGGGDAAEAMWKRKVDERAPFSAELAQAGIRYRPFVFTTYGRPHPAASEAIAHIAKVAARRKGWAAKGVEKRLRACIGTVLARRAARMSLATRPHAEVESMPDVTKHFEDDPGAPLRSGMMSSAQPSASRVAGTGPVVALVTSIGGATRAAAVDIRLQP